MLRRLGRLDESIAAYRRLVAGAPGQAAAATAVLLATVPGDALSGWAALDSETLAAAATRPPLSDFLADPLFVALASRTILMEPAIERLLTRLRRSVLLGRAEG